MGHGLWVVGRGGNTTILWRGLASQAPAIDYRLLLMSPRLGISFVLIQTPVITLGYEPGESVIFLLSCKDFSCYYRSISETSIYLASASISFRDSLFFNRLVKAPARRPETTFFHGLIFPSFRSFWSKNSENLSFHPKRQSKCKSNSTNFVCPRQKINQCIHKYVSFFITCH